MQLAMMREVRLEMVVELRLMIHESDERKQRDRDDSLSDTDDPHCNNFTFHAHHARGLFESTRGSAALGVC